MKFEFKSYNEQIEILKNVKNVKFATKDDENEFINLLKRSNYINVINPYKIYFLTGKRDGKHLYDNPTDYKDYVKHFEFDLNASHQLLGVVFEFERYFSTSVAHKLSQSLSIDPTYFSKIEAKSFKTLVSQRVLKEENIAEKYYTTEFQQKLRTLVLSLSDATTADIKKAYDIHEFRKKVRSDYSISNIALNEWFYKINFMSFEDVLFLYKIMSNEDQLTIANLITGGGVPTEHFKKIVRSIKKLRNKLAHLENLTIIINKQLKTDSQNMMENGDRVFSTIKKTYSYLGKLEPEFIYELARLHKVRREKYLAIKI